MIRTGTTLQAIGFAHFGEGKLLRFHFSLLRFRAPA